MPSAIRLILRSVAAQPGASRRTLVANAAQWSRLSPRRQCRLWRATIEAPQLRSIPRAGPLPAAGHHARFGRTAKEGGADGAQDLRHPALARLSHPVDGE